MVEYDVTFRGMEGSDALRDDVLDQARGLRRFAPEMHSCSVVLEPAVHAASGGRRFSVKVHVALQGMELHVGCATPAGRDIENSDTAVHDAFLAMRRKLQDLHRRQRGEVTIRQSSSHGRISRLDADSGCGVIDTRDDREVSFHRGSVVDGSFDRLVEGDEVVLTEIHGAHGAWVSTVHLLKRPWLI